MDAKMWTITESGSRLWAIRGQDGVSSMETAVIDRENQGSKSVQGTSLPTLLDRRGLAEYLDCSVRTLDRMISAGQLPEPQIGVKNCARWTESQIEKWIASRPKSKRVPKSKKTVCSEQTERLKR